MLNSNVTGSFSVKVVSQYDGHVHNAENLQKVAAVEATPEHDGNIEYWKCTEYGCDKKFADASGSEELSDSDIIVPYIVDFDDWSNSKYLETNYDWRLTYNGMNQVPDVVVTYKGRFLTEGTDYNIAFPAESIKPGYYEATLTFCGRYKGSADIDYNIVCTHEYKSGASAFEANDDRVEPTCTRQGSYSETCAICGETRDVSIKALGHDYDYAHGVEIVPATESEGGQIEYTCTRPGCGHKKIENTPKLESDEVSYSYDWADDNSTVTAKTINKATGVVVDTETVKASSKITKAPTCTETGVRTFTSGKFTNKSYSIQRKTVEIAVDEDAHSWGDWFSKNGDYHRRECVNNAAAHYQEAEHCWNDGVVTIEATETSEGERTFTCTVCKATKTVKIPKTEHKHVLKRVGEVYATCTEPGVKSYYKCTAANCPTPILEDDGVTPTTLEALATDPLGHDWGKWYETKAATDTEEGEETRVCDRCEEKQTRSTPVLGHVHTTVGTAAKAATHTEDGNRAYWTCTGCGRYFSNEAATREIEKDSWVISKKPHVFDKEVASDKYLKTKADCTHKAVYYKSCECGEKGSETFESGSALGHDYKFSKFEWTKTANGYTAQAVYVCSRDSSHVEKHNATVTSQTTAATCEASGKTVYTASYDGHTETKTDSITKLPHDYKFSKFEWTKSGSGYTAKALYVCSRDSSHVVRYDAAVTSQTTAATCKAEGKTVYTAAYDGHTDTKTETIAKTAHKPVTVSGRAATCTDAGLTDGEVCSVCNTVLKEQTTIPALGHDWGEWTVVKDATYDEDGLERHVCKRDGAHVEERTIPKKAKTSITIASATIKNMTWTGKALKPAVKLTLSDGTVLKSGRDYTLKYANNKNVGTAKVIVTGINGFEGSKTFTFRINPKGTALSKLTAEKKGFTVKWNSQKKQTTGYEIQYSLKKNFKGAKTVTVKGKAKDKKILSKKVVKLKAKKKYFVRVRTFKKIGKTKYVSAWSKVKTVTTKK